MNTSVDIARVTSIIGEVADEFILPYFGRLKEGDISFKTGDDPVTVADKLCELHLSRRLSELLPGSKSLGEEGFAANPGILDIISGESPVWIIDPVDGTRNFARGSREFGVIVALAKQKQIVAGWIYDPTSREVVTAEQGGGAFHQGQRLKTLPPAALPDMRGFIGERMNAVYASAPRQPPQPRFEISHCGSHEHPRLWIDGPHFGKDKPPMHFSVSWHFCTPWDFAASTLIHREAGGCVRQWNGEDYDPSIMHRGIAFAPDRESWDELMGWCRSFCPPKVA